MLPPRFWDNPPDRPGWQARALAPLAMLYSGATARRVARGGGRRAGVPVVCVGNVSVGGTGKTPTAIALVERLSGRGVRAHVVSRGHGGSLPGPISVDPRRHDSDMVGDEPLLLAAFAPVWVSKDRAEGARAAEEAGAEAIVLDDGFQNPSVMKDLSVVVVDAERGFGNGRVLPAGPLREPAAAGLRRADLVLAIGEVAACRRFRRDLGERGRAPVLSGRLEPLSTGMDWRRLPVLAFAGIGHPEKFFRSLREVGADVRHAEPLADHQPLSTRLMRRLEADAAFLGAQLVTTEKDATRLPKSFRGKVLTLPVRLQIDDWEPLDAALAGLGLADGKRSGRPLQKLDRD